MTTRVGRTGPGPDIKLSVLVEGAVAGHLCLCAGGGMKSRLLVDVSVAVARWHGQELAATGDNQIP